MILKPFHILITHLPTCGSMSLPPMSQVVSARQECEQKDVSDYGSQDGDESLHHSSMQSEPLGAVLPSVILELSPSDFKPEDQSYQEHSTPSPSHCNCSSITFERGDWRMREVHAASASGEVTCSYAELVAETWIYPRLFKRHELRRLAS